jgi:NAD(P)-dependent dehydrogenase (short-subunit alcohol dehydrogenase family)
MTELADKVVIVTGAAQGTGLGIARRAVAEGARVVATCKTKERAAAAGSAQRPVRPPRRRERGDGRRR